MHRHKDTNLEVVLFAPGGVDINRIEQGTSTSDAPNNATDSAGTCQHGTAAIRKLDGERKEKQERSQASQLPHSC